MSSLRSVIAGLVPAISIRKAQCPTIGMAGTSPAMTNEKYRSFLTGKLDIRPIAASPRESISKDLQS